MKKLIFILALFCISYSGMAQFNDTIFYKSGVEKVVEITEYTDALLKFKKVNLKGETVNSQVGKNLVLRYVIYDEEGMLQYDSKTMDENFEDVRQGHKYPVKVAVSKHQLAINLLTLPFLSFSGKYNYRFGNKMQFSICSRATYLRPILSEFYYIDYRGNAFAGLGFQYSPFYNNRFAFGLDIMPMICFFDTVGSNDVYLFLPVNVDFDFYFNDTFGISADLGAGPVYRNTNDFFDLRVNLGLLIQFKDKKTFDTEYR